MKVKIERINSELARQIAKIIAENIKDPRLGDAIIGVTKVSTTPDLKYAKVYLSIYSQNDEVALEAYHTVVRASSFIRNKLKGAVNVRLLPELKFLIDDTYEQGMKIEKLLMQIHLESQNTPESEQSSGQDKDDAN